MQRIKTMWVEFDNSFTTKTLFIVLKTLVPDLVPIDWEMCKTGFEYGLSCLANDFPQ